MVATGRGAAMGTPFRRDPALEALARVDTLVLDKTGTITRGKPTLTEFQAYGISEDEALALVAAVERYSEHPIAGAIVGVAKGRFIGVDPETRCDRPGDVVRTSGFRSIAAGNITQLIGCCAPYSAALTEN